MATVLNPKRKVVQCTWAVVLHLHDPDEIRALGQLPVPSFRLPKTLKQA